MSRRKSVRPTISQIGRIAQAVSPRFGVEQMDLWLQPKSSEHVAARSLCFWLLRRKLKFNLTGIALATGWSQPVVSRAVEHVDTMIRSSPAYQVLLNEVWP